MLRLNPNFTKKLVKIFDRKNIDNILSLHSFSLIILKRVYPTGNFIFFFPHRGAVKFNMNQINCKNKIYSEYA
jgi:ABC-type microcin C transport system permease subunit YejB